MAISGDVSPAPHFTLNNGVQIPALGFGVFQTPPDQTIAAVATALATGYRHIDTAAAYANEREVGEAIRRSGLDRSEIFVETKIWISDYGYDQTLHAFDKSAGKLGLDRIDLLILHQALHAGQTVYRPPDEEHWHGAAPDSFMEHLAMLDNADDPATTTTWLEHVTDDDYRA